MQKWWKLSLLSVVLPLIVVAASIKAPQNGFPNNPQKGDLVTYNGSNWVRLPVGSSNQVLTPTNGILVWSTQSSSGGSYASPYTYYVAASNAPQWEKAFANYQATGTNDQIIINQAISSAASVNGTVVLSDGLFRCSGSILIPEKNGSTNIQSFKGQGKQATQILQYTSNVDLFVIGGATANIVSLYVGDISVATVAGTGNAFTLTYAVHSTFENIIVTGAGNDGFRLNAVMISDFIDVEVSTNFYPIPGSISGFNKAFEFFGLNNNYCNANTFIHPVYEGGNYGVYINDQAGYQGGNTWTGGTIEGIKNTGFYAVNSSGIQLNGVWFEANGLDVSWNNVIHSTLRPTTANNVNISNSSYDYIGGDYGILTQSNNSHMIVETY